MKIKYDYVYKLTLRSANHVLNKNLKGQDYSGQFIKKNDVVFLRKYFSKCHNIFIPCPQIQNE